MMLKASLDKIPKPKVPLYEVSGMTLIPQSKERSCWYASAQMLIHWKMNRLNQSLTNLVPPEFDALCRTVRDANTGIDNPFILNMAKKLGLRAVPPMSPTPQALRTWLQQYGPLWVNGVNHIVVIAGINDMQVKVYDPWPQDLGMINWRSLTHWYVAKNPPKTKGDSSRDSGSDVTTVFLYCP